MNRTERLIPAGWVPGIRSRVAFTDAPDSPAPPGAWLVTDRAPDPGCWWVCPAEDMARRWLAAHPSQALQGHLLLDGRRGAQGRRMVPAGHTAGHPGTVNP